MPEAPKTAQTIDTKFTAPITQDNNSGWTCVLMPGSSEFFGTGRAVKVAGTVDGHAFQATMLPVGNGVHMLPLKAALRKVLAKDQGDEITVHLEQRFS
ncbi:MULTISPECIES: DUF1905 domain-containing protein [Streptomyces]|uniref:DUF1905 domain-containing protein n=2 Tax=Streptomyces TaxID=1883 RepID=A0A939FQI1_9ACTN|nr:MULTISPECIES: DUF1905 domain-containing protein [Streptomyces]MBO0655517.1 DUF1905 domain-containing protein [Streptomyces triculaminicus]QSY50652.1 DUF1905 domain-containing protein [Streptomyces griseocarneus]